MRHIKNINFPYGTNGKLMVYVSQVSHYLSTSGIKFGGLVQVAFGGLVQVAFNQSFIIEKARGCFIK